MRRSVSLRFVHFFLFFCLASGLAVAAPTRSPDAGRRIVRNYTAEEYGAQPQNWCVARDARGVMYFGNNDGVLVYDGVRWRLIPIPNGSPARSILALPDGRIFVGAVGDFGQLADGPDGRLRFVSLVERLPAAERTFADIWETVAAGNTVCFRGEEAVFLWDGANLRALRPERPAERFQLGSAAGDRIWLKQKEIGLVFVRDGAISRPPGGGWFAKKQAYAVLPFDAARVLVATREDGLVLFDGTTATPFAPDASAWLRENLVYNGCALPDGRFAFVTLRAGAGIVDRDGALVETLGRASGLQNDTGYAVFGDASGSLWLALDDGVARAELSSPVSFFDEKNGVPATTYAGTDWNGAFYLATAGGVVRLKPGAGTFEPVDGLKLQSWTLLPVEEGLLVGAYEGVFLLKTDGQVVKIIDSEGNTALVFRRKPDDPNEIFIGRRGGLTRLRRENGEWRDAGAVAGIREQVRTLAFAADGTLWCGTGADGLLAVTPGGSAFKSFKTSDGLPFPTGNAVAEINGEVWVTTRRGLRRAEKGGLAPLAVHPEVDGAETGGLLRGPDGRLHLVADGRPVTLVPDGKGWNTDRRLFGLIPEGSFDGMFFDANGVVWLGTAKRLYRCDPRVPAPPPADAAPLVRRVGAGAEAVLFDGLDPSRGMTVTSFENNRLRFECGFPAYAREGGNRFQYRLDGEERDWSAWTAEPFRDYTLREGEYTFRVRARDAFGAVSREAVYRVRVRPPVWRTWWAYLLYMGIAVGLTFVGFRLRLRQLRRRTVELENKVAARTSELNAAVSELRDAHAEAEARNRQLSAANDRIADQNRQLDRKVAELELANRQADRIFTALAEAMPGTTLEDRYRLEDRIGAGGFGVVFRGRHLALDRPVAIKVFRPAAANASAESVERFQREGIAMCRIAHPNAVAVLDSGVSDDGIAYIVMELLVGHPLSEELKIEGRLTLRRCSKILDAVCGALAAAHAAGIIHRDIKPDNVFLNRTETGEETVKVLDFGIAKLMDLQTERESGLTRPGDIVGTPAYVAPERISGDDYDGKSDVYSVGVMLYQMMVGRPPFLATGENMVSVFLDHLHNEPRAPRSFNPSIPAAVEAVVLSALRKSPADRPDPLELAASFAAALADVPEELLGSPTSPLPTRYRPPTGEVNVGGDTVTRADAPTEAAGATLTLLAPDRGAETK
jgi:serine/threonine protein kinase/ligand-binding sensor domain-containing protein